MIVFVSIVPANIRSSVYCTALAEAGMSEWEFVWGRFNQSNVESEKEEMLKALCCSRENRILNRLVGAFGIKVKRQVTIIITPSFWSI